MCLSLATGSIGGLLNVYAADQEKQDMASTFANEIKTQQAFGNEGLPLAQNNVIAGGADAAAPTLADAVRQRTADYAGAGGASAPVSVGSNPQAASNPEAMQAYTDAVGKEAANWNSYGDWQTQVALKNAQTQNQLNRISMFARNRAQNVFPYQMYDAQNSQQGLQALAGLIEAMGGAGQAALNTSSLQPVVKTTSPSVGFDTGGAGIGGIGYSGGLDMGAGPLP